TAARSRTTSSPPPATRRAATRRSSPSTAGGTLAQCTAGFVIDSSSSTGAGLGGDLTLNPELVNAGDSSDASYTVRNQGNATLAGLAIRVLLLDPDTGAIAGELNDTATLAPGASFSAT